MDSQFPELAFHDWLTGAIERLADSFLRDRNISNLLSRE
jgi:hypothetical protein